MRATATTIAQELLDSGIVYFTACFEIYDLHVHHGHPSCARAPLPPRLEVPRRAQQGELVVRLCHQLQPDREPVLGESARYAAINGTTRMSANEGMHECRSVNRSIRQSIDRD